MVPLPIPTKDNYKVLLYRLADMSPEKVRYEFIPMRCSILTIARPQFHFNEAIKMFFMVADVRLACNDLNGITDGEIPVFDMAGLSLKHITRVVLSTLRVYMKFTQVNACD